MKRVKSNDKRNRFPWFYDRLISIVFFTLVTIGLVMVASASMVISDQQYAYPFHYLLRQVSYLTIGVLLAWLVTRVPMDVWYKISGYLFSLSIFLLVLVLVPGIGKMVNGSRRWLNLIVITLQVSEVVKLCAVLYLASYIQRFSKEIKATFLGFIKPIMILGLIAILLLLEPNFGALVVISCTFLVLLFIAGVRVWLFSLVLAGVSTAMLGLIILSPYRLARLTNFLDPWHNQFGSGYQLTQSLIAFGRGGFFGVGLGNSVQKVFYLPFAHTDFLFAVIAEELGLMGCLAVITLFLVLIGRMMIIGWQALSSDKMFSAYVVFGFALWFSFQILVNIGVNVGVLPTKGLTLPFMSYGGSSIIINCVVIGIVLRVAYENSFERSDVRIRASKPGNPIFTRI